MHDPTNVGGPLIAQYLDDVRCGFTSMNYQWLFEFARRANVSSKAVALPIEVALAAKIIEPSLPDGNDRRVTAERQ